MNEKPLLWRELIEPEKDDVKEGIVAFWTGDDMPDNYAKVSELKDHMLYRFATELAATLTFNKEEAIKTAQQLLTANRNYHAIIGSSMSEKDLEERREALRQKIGTDLADALNEQVNERIRHMARTRELQKKSEQEFKDAVNTSRKFFEDLFDPTVKKGQTGN